MTYLLTCALALLLASGPAGASPLYTVDGWSGAVITAAGLCAGGIVEEFLAWLPGVLLAVLALALALYENRRSRLVREQLTQLQRAHQTLAANEQRYRQLLETGQLGLWQLDADGRTLYLNTVMSRLLAVENVADLAKPASPGLIPVENTLLPKAYGCYEAVLVNQHGQPRQVLVAEIPLAAPVTGQLRLVFVPSQTAVSHERVARVAGRASPPPSPMH